MGNNTKETNISRSNPPKKTQPDLQWPDSVLMDKGHGSDGIMVNQQFRVVLRERERERERERLVDLVI